MTNKVRDIYDKNIEMYFKLDAKRSENDDRDWIAENILSKDIKYPNNLDLRVDLPPVRNQGNQGSCVAQSCSCIKEWQERKQIGFKDYMSPQFIYNNRENYPESGMYGRDAMEILMKKGCCFEKTYPYGKDEDANDIDEKVYDEATKYNIKSYAQVKTIDGLKSVLYMNGPCCILFPVYNYGASFWKKTMSTDEILGGHAVAIVGYNNEGFILRNSWGTSWNDKGYTIYPYVDFGLHWEIWSTIDNQSPSLDEEKEDKNCNCCKIS